MGGGLGDTFGLGWESLCHSLEIRSKLGLFTNFWLEFIMNKLRFWSFDRFEFWPFHLDHFKSGPLLRKFRTISKSDPDHFNLDHFKIKLSEPFRTFDSNSYLIRQYLSSSGSVSLELAIFELGNLGFVRTQDTLKEFELIENDLGNQR